MKHKIQSIVPPRIYKANDGKTYILPYWIETSDNVTMDDVEWIKPVYEEKPKPIKINNYNTRFDAALNKYLCGCQGYWRAKDKELGCKHIQQIRSGVSKN